MVEQSVLQVYIVQAYWRHHHLPASPTIFMITIDEVMAADAVRKIEREHMDYEHVHTISGPINTWVGPFTFQSMSSFQCNP